MFKNNKKGIIALALVLVLAVAALFVWQAAKPETQQGSKEIIVNVDHLNGDDASYTIYTDAEYLRAALEQENLIEGTESQYGLYITSVDGEAADESKQEWWGYSVNGAFAELGVDSQPVADGDDAVGGAYHPAPFSRSFIRAGRPRENARWSDAEYILCMLVSLLSISFSLDVTSAIICSFCPASLPADTFSLRAAVKAMH